MKKQGLPPALITTPFMALVCTLEKAHLRFWNPPLFHRITHHEAPLPMLGSSGELP
jgi:hypothetical protein